MKYILLFILFLGCMCDLSFSQTSTGCGQGKVYVCHKEKITLCISENAVPAHLAHGDYLGVCNAGSCDVTCSGGIISCADPTVTLRAISNASGVSYSWIGPNGFISNQPSPTVGLPGQYTITVNDTLTGCTSAASTTVTQDTISPDITAEVAGSLTCTTSTIMLKGNSTTQGAVYKWSGPGGFTSNAQNPATTEPGNYKLRVTNPQNGCNAASNVILNADTVSPGNVNANVSGNLNCKVRSVTLTATSSITNATYNWLGPYGFSVANNKTLVDKPGRYSVRVTNPANGCAMTKILKVAEDTRVPSDVSASASGILSCKDTAETLQGTTLSTGVSYSWTGPDNFTSAMQNPVVYRGGKYRLIVTSTTNGCSAKDSVVLKQDTIPPANVVAKVSGMLSCNNTFVTLNGSSDDTNAQYSWTGPKNYVASGTDVLTEGQGNYKLTSTDPLNGCSSATTITVAMDSTNSGCDSTTAAIIHVRMISDNNLPLTIDPVDFANAGNQKNSDEYPLMN